MKSYLSLIPISARVHRRQNRKMCIRDSPFREGREVQSFFLTMPQPPHSAVKNLRQRGQHYP